jgi:hypothetical protein
MPQAQTPWPSQSWPPVGHESLVPAGNGVQAGTAPVVQIGHDTPPLLDEPLEELLDDVLDELPAAPLEVDPLEEEALIPPEPPVSPDEPDDASEETCSSGAQAEAAATRNRGRDKRMMSR